MSVFDKALDLFRGKAVTIPPMDGALKPNTLLDDAEVLVAALAPDNLVVQNGALVYSSGAEIRSHGAKAPLARHAADITALAVHEDGRMAVGLDSGKVLVGDLAIDGFTCPTALAFDGADLLVCNGSATSSPSAWTTDLMQRNATGSIWRVNLATRERKQLAGGLAFPNGLAIDRANRRLVASESWNHCLIALPLTGGAAQPLLTHLPGYPSRITPYTDGYLLCLFAPLNRLVEFVLQEDAYRQDMMQEIESQFWIAPALAPASSFLEPLQNGGVRSMGVHKPWSPTRSYGLLVSLDSAFQPVASFHSRANGRFHGITSALSHQGRIIVTSKGGNHIIALRAEDVA
jgi:hypothetical protein